MKSHCSFYLFTYARYVSRKSTSHHYNFVEMFWEFMRYWIVSDAIFRCWSVSDVMISRQKSNSWQIYQITKMTYKFVIPAFTLSLCCQIKWLSSIFDNHSIFSKRLSQTLLDFSNTCVIMIYAFVNLNLPGKNTLN